MSRTGVAWGFLAAGFMAPGVALITDYSTGWSAGLLAAAIWCAVLAIAEWQPPTGGGE